MNAALVALGYVAGSIPFGVLLTRWRAGVDVRSRGSGNIGATNVARVAGRKLGLLVLALDALKGTLPVLLSLWLVPGEPRLHAGVGLAAFLGHVFPVWLKFQGGKGVATALGVLAVLVPWAALCGALVYVLVFSVLRVSSVGSLAGGTSAVVAAFLLPGPREYAGLTALLLVADALDPPRQPEAAGLADRVQALARRDRVARGVLEQRAGDRPVPQLAAGDRAAGGRRSRTPRCRRGRRSATRRAGSGSRRGGSRSSSSPSGPRP